MALSKITNFYLRDWMCQGSMDSMNYVFDQPEQASLEVVGDERRFPVRRVFCVGRNYGEHAREMGHDPDREPPFFFCKPADAVCDVAETWPYPPLTSNLHHEIELVVLIDKEGKDIAIEKANEHIFGFAIGLDMTRRDLQGQAKKMGRPWDWGKGFDFSAPCGPVHKLTETGHIESGSIWLKINGDLKQSGDICELIWSIPEVISIVSQSVVLKPGDVIMTGTPAGVGPLEKGDVMCAGIDGLGEIESKVV